MELDRVRSLRIAHLPDRLLGWLRVGDVLKGSQILSRLSLLRHLEIVGCLDRLIHRQISHRGHLGGLSCSRGPGKPLLEVLQTLRRTHLTQIIWIGLNIVKGKGRFATVEIRVNFKCLSLWFSLSLGGRGRPVHAGQLLLSVIQSDALNCLVSGW